MAEKDMERDLMPLIHVKRDLTIVQAINIAAGFLYSFEALFNWQETPKLTFPLIGLVIVLLLSTNMCTLALLKSVLVIKKQVEELHGK